MALADSLIMKYELSEKKDAEWLKDALAVAFVAALMLLPHSARAADARFTQFIAALWPEAQAAGHWLAGGTRSGLGTWQRTPSPFSLHPFPPIR